MAHLLYFFWTFSLILKDLYFFISSPVSRRLVGELIVYRGVRRPSVRRPSVINIFKRLLLWSRKADSFHISHIASIGRGNKKLCFCSDRIRTLVAMATYSSHGLIMGKRGNWQYFLSHWGYLEFFLQKCLLSSPHHFIWFLFKSVNLIGCPGGKKGQFS